MLHREVGNRGGEEKEYTVMAVITWYVKLSEHVYSAGGYEAITFSESVFRGDVPGEPGPNTLSVWMLRTVTSGQYQFIWSD